MGRMRSALRLLLCLLLSSSIALAAIPVQVQVHAGEIEKQDCCAKMAGAKSGDGCARHAPASSEEKQCCLACAFGLALFLDGARSFVYPPVGDEAFAAFVSTELSRSDRPPVPPPRA